MSTPQGGRRSSTRSTPVADNAASQSVRSTPRVVRFLLDRPDAHRGPARSPFAPTGSPGASPDSPSVGPASLMGQTTPLALPPGAYGAGRARVTVRRHRGPATTPPSLRRSGGTNALSLPPHLLERVLSCLPPSDAPALLLVCRAWRHCIAVQSPHLWEAWALARHPETRVRVGAMPVYTGNTPVWGAPLPALCASAGDAAAAPAECASAGESVAARRYAAILAQCEGREAPSATPCEPEDGAASPCGSERPHRFVGGVRVWLREHDPHAALTGGDALTPPGAGSRSRRSLSPPPPIESLLLRVAADAGGGGVGEEEDEDEDDEDDEECSPIALAAAHSGSGSGTGSYDLPPLPPLPVLSNSGSDGAPAPVAVAVVECPLRAQARVYAIKPILKPPRASAEDGDSARVVVPLPAHASAPLPAPATAPPSRTMHRAVAAAHALAAAVYGRAAVSPALGATPSGRAVPLLAQSPGLHAAASPVAMPALPAGGALHSPYSPAVARARSIGSPAQPIIEPTARQRGVARSPVAVQASAETVSTRAGDALLADAARVGAAINKACRGALRAAFAAAQAQAMIEREQACAAAAAAAAVQAAAPCCAEEEADNEDEEDDEDGMPLSDSEDDDDDDDDDEEEEEEEEEEQDGDEGEDEDEDAARPSDSWESDACSDDDEEEASTDTERKRCVMARARSHPKPKHAAPAPAAQRNKAGRKPAPAAAATRLRHSNSAGTSGAAVSADDDTSGDVFYCDRLVRAADGRMVRVRELRRVRDNSIVSAVVVPTAARGTKVARFVRQAAAVNARRTDAPVPVVVVGAAAPVPAIVAASVSAASSEAEAAAALVAIAGDASDVKALAGGRHNLDAVAALLRAASKAVRAPGDNGGSDEDEDKDEDDGSTEDGDVTAAVPVAPMPLSLRAPFIARRAGERWLRLMARGLLPSHRAPRLAAQPQPRRAATASPGLAAQSPSLRGAPSPLLGPSASPSSRASLATMLHPPAIGGQQQQQSASFESLLGAAGTWPRDAARAFTDWTGPHAAADAVQPSFAFVGAPRTAAGRLPEPVIALAMHGPTLVAASPFAVRVFSRHTGERLATFCPHATRAQAEQTATAMAAQAASAGRGDAGASTITAVAAQGALVAAATANAGICVWGAQGADAARGTASSCLGRKGMGAITALQFLHGQEDQHQHQHQHGGAGDTLLATASIMGALALWSPETGRCVAQFSLRPTVTAVAAATATTAASAMAAVAAAADPAARLRVGAGGLMRAAAGHEGGPASVRDVLAALAAPRHAPMHEDALGQARRAACGDDAGVGALTSLATVSAHVAVTGGVLASGRGCVSVWDVRVRGGGVAHVAGGLPAGATALHVDVGGWATDPAAARRQDGAFGGGIDIAASGSGHLLVAGCADGSLRAWDVRKLASTQPLVVRLPPAQQQHAQDGDDSGQALPLSVHVQRPRPVSVQARRCGGDSRIAAVVADESEDDDKDDDKDIDAEDEQDGEIWGTHARRKTWRDRPLHAQPVAAAPAPAAQAPVADARVRVVTALAGHGGFLVAAQPQQITHLLLAGGAHTTADTADAAACDAHGYGAAHVLARWLPRAFADAQAAGGVAAPAYEHPDPFFYTTEAWMSRREESDWCGEDPRLLRERRGIRAAAASLGLCAQRPAQAEPEDAAPARARHTSHFHAVAFDAECGGLAVSFDNMVVMWERERKAPWRL